MPLLDVSEIPVFPRVLGIVNGWSHDLSQAELRVLNLGSRQPHMNSPEFQSSKRLKSSLSAPERYVSSRSTISRVSRYPEAAPRLHREVHAPVRPQKFGSFTALSQFRASTSTATSFGGEEYSGSKMGNILSKKYEKFKRSALDSLRFFKANQTLELVDEETQKEVLMSKDSSVESIEVDDGLKGVDKVANLQESVISELSNGHVVRMDKAGELDPMSLDRDDGDLGVLSKNAYKKLLEEVHRREPKLEGLEFEIKFVQEKWSSLQLQRPPKKLEEVIFIFVSCFSWSLHVLHMFGSSFLLVISGDTQ